jgi:ATP-dependent Clp protease ATP-binding subunit ClpC
MIVVFNDLPALLQSASAIQADVVSLMYPYLTSRGVQVIAVADKTRFHEAIENNGMLMNTFEVLRLAERDERLLTAILETEVLAVEAETGLYFTYPAVEAVAQSAVRFFSDGVPLDKAKDILAELPTVLARQKKRVVVRDDVLALAAQKTGIPQEGNVSEEEKQKLLHLEEALHKHVIGQKEAIDAIANTMRRARAGLRNPNRPIGSFLFLGPTGVGKTETAKSLDEVFFGKDAPMLRLDMSEYTGADALQRLIGSFEANKPGTLATLLRDQKYGVLLLDEFEKTTPEVHNLFLQVLDEGYFSDMHGKRVNARNVIIIATSNAGSDRIFKMVEEGKDLTKEKAALLDSLVAEGRFKPELINRFDGVILFHPLSGENVGAIAELAAKKLADELALQGFKLTITPDLIAYLSREGFDPKYGARAMNRVLQEKVEKLLAEGIINSQIQKGATIEFVRSPQDANEIVVQSAQ